MNTYEFTIKTEQNEKTEEIQFIIEDNYGELSGQSFNPTTYWTGYTQFDQGWSEQDEDLNELLRAIKDYSQSPDLINLLYENENNLNKPINTTYYCDGYVTENREYTFTVTITDITMGSN